MESQSGKSGVRVWRPEGLDNLELRRGVRVFDPVPKHWHEEYQLCLIERGRGELQYRRGTYETPSASVFLISPGEVHSNRSLEKEGCCYRTIFFDVDLMLRAVESVSDRKGLLPCFDDAVLRDRGTIKRFLGVHRTFERSSSTLERETGVENLLAHLIFRYASQKPTLRPERLEREAIKKVREYLVDHSTENVRLADLVQITNLSSYHLTRVFTAEVGLPPHAFLTQVRVSRARDLLRRGVPASEVALNVGFADQSHLARHFKKLCVVTPGQYQKSFPSQREPCPAGS